MKCPVYRNYMMTYGHNSLCTYNIFRTTLIRPVCNDPLPNQGEDDVQSPRIIGEDSK